jgi:transcriptional regulator with XRE-family HTH domain
MMVRFGERVREYRQRLGLSQEDLGHRAAIDPRTIRNLETGRRVPRPATIRQLADGLELVGQERERFCASAAHGVDEHRPPTTPRLPPNVFACASRGVVLALLDELLAEADGSAVPIAVICSLPGAGKTALSVHWAHAVPSLLHDGQLKALLREVGAHLRH